MENPVKIDDLGVPLFLEHPYIPPGKDRWRNFHGSWLIMAPDKHSPPVGSYVPSTFTTVFFFCADRIPHPPEAHFQNFRASNV